MPPTPRSILCALTLTGAAGPAFAQDAVLVYQLGRDTMAVEQYTRTANRLTGEVVSRLGAAVTRLQYDVMLNANGRPISATIRIRSAAGTPLANQPSEIRLTFTGDSVKREAVFADSVNVRMVSAPGAVLFQSPAHGLYEVAFAQLRRNNTQTFTQVSGAGGTAALTFTAVAADTVRGTNNIIYRVDREGRLLSVDATNTTQKLTAMRGTARVDLNALASAMTAAGMLSARGQAHGSFMQSAIFINYGRPLVRERTVWGGVLVPFDAVWRTGANEATHLATTRELTLGNVVVPPGLYTLWINNARSGPQLIINRQIGQWGTAYNPANDLGRVPMRFTPTPEHVEEFTITIRNLGGNRGAVEFAWANMAAVADFTVR